MTYADRLPVMRGENLSQVGKWGVAQAPNHARYTHFTDGHLVETAD